MLDRFARFILVLCMLGLASATTAVAEEITRTGRFIATGSSDPNLVLDSPNTITLTFDPFGNLTPLSGTVKSHIRNTATDAGDIWEGVISWGRTKWYPDEKYGTCDSNVDVTHRWYGYPPDWPKGTSGEETGLFGTVSCQWGEFPPAEEGRMIGSFLIGGANGGIFELEIEEQPPPVVASISVRVDPKKIIPDGQSTSTIYATVKDDQENPAAGVQVTLTRFPVAPPPLGELLSDKCTTDANGQCSVVYRAPQPAAVFRNGEEGAIAVTLKAEAGDVSEQFYIDFIYLTLLQEAPADGTRNWPDLLDLHSTPPAVGGFFNREVDGGSLTVETFRVRSRSFYRQGMSCSYGTEANQAFCALPFFPSDEEPEEYKKGLVITVELQGGETGIRGADGTMLRKKRAWTFSTLPKLSPRIIPVQISDDADLALHRFAIVRVHAGIAQDSELDFLEAAAVRIGWRNVDQLSVLHHRFYPGELGGPPENAQRGNSANFSVPWDIPYSFLFSSGEHDLEAKLEFEVPALDTVRTEHAYKTVQVTGADLRLRYELWPVALEGVQAVDSDYDWVANTTVPALGQADILRGKSALNRLLPALGINYKPPELKISSLDAGLPNLPWRSYLSKVLRSVDARTPYGFRQGRVFAEIVVVPGGWMRKVNDGDPIFHPPPRTGDVPRLSCIVGHDAPAEAVPHCFGHLLGLRDDRWASQGAPVLKGFDIERNRLVDNAHLDILGPDYSFPLMTRELGVVSPGTNRVWIDAENYRGIVAAIGQSPQDRASSASFEAVDSMGKLTVGGELKREYGSVTGGLDIVELQTTGEPFFVPEGGEYELRLTDETHAVLASHTFTPAFDAPQEGAEYASFLYMLPAPPGLRYVELLHGESVLSEVAASASPPQITVDEPLPGDYAGPVDVRWSASDPDGDDLRFTIYYSSDAGDTWTLLALGIAGSEYSIDTAKQPSCDQCKIKVVAHDGFHTAEADSGTFRVRNPPQVAWVWPTDGSQDAPAYTTVRASFLNPMNEGTIDTSTFTLVDGNGFPVGGSVAYDADAAEALFSPDAPLEYRETYTATVHGSVRDAFGQSLEADYVWTFAAERSPSYCVGDCNQDGRVSVDELVTSVGIAVDEIPIERCEWADDSGDAVVAVDELVRCVNSTLYGCFAGGASVPTPGASPTATATGGTTATPTPTPPTVTPTPTQPSATVTMTHTPDETPTKAPLVRTYCGELAAPLAIPDSDAEGIFGLIALDDLDRVTDVDVQLNIDHTWVGDLAVTLTHQATGRTVALLDRPGYPEGDLGCDGENIACVVDDEADERCEDLCAASPALAGHCRPTDALDTFAGERAAGLWEIAVTDLASGDVGELTDWCLAMTLSPAPTPEGDEAPIVTDFTCNGDRGCMLEIGEPYTLAFDYLDTNGDAASWELRATRDDGTEYNVDSGTLTPGGGTIALDRDGFECEGTCATTWFDFHVTVTDAGGRESGSAKIRVVVLGN